MKKKKVQSRNLSQLKKFKDLSELIKNERIMDILIDISHHSTRSYDELSIDTDYKMHDIIHAGTVLEENGFIVRTPTPLSHRFMLTEKGKVLIYLVRN